MGKLASGQDTFKALLRDEVAPFLRGHGLKGSGRISGSWTRAATSGW